MELSSSSSSSSTTLQPAAKPKLPDMDAASIFFLCPISMELMQDPVTVSTGVTYERRSIEKWLFTYRKRTCPATMKELDSLDLTPNHTLQRLITSWSASSPPPTTATVRSHDELTATLHDVEAPTPFKVTALRKLRAKVSRASAGAALLDQGGVEVLCRALVRLLAEPTDFATFRAGEEAVAVLHHLPLDAAATRLLLAPDAVSAMSILLRRGSADAKTHAVAVLDRIAKSGRQYWSARLSEHGGAELHRPLLDLLLSDEVSPWATSSALDVLTELLRASKKKRPAAVEAGAVSLLVELLPDSNRHKCEKLMFLLKLLCECAEGRSALAEHGMGIAAVSEKVMRVSEAATKLGVKVMWLVCRFLPSERVLDEMMASGAVRELLGLLQADGGEGRAASSSARELAGKILKLHGVVWQQYPCFPGRPVGHDQKI